MKILRYSLLFLACYLLFAIATLPANTVYAYWKEYFGARVAVQAGAVEGSVWAAKAENVTIQGKQLKSLSWDVHVLKMLLGRVELGSELEIQDGYVKATVGRSLMGDLYANDIEAWLPLEQIAQYANLQALRPDGSLAVNLQHLVVADQQLTDAMGNVSWHEAEISLLETVRLGDLSLDLEPDADGIKGQISDKGGPLQAEGLVTLSKQGDYNLRLALSSRDPQQRALENALRGLGRPDATGKYNISRNGNINQLGLF